MTLDKIKSVMPCTCGEEYTSRSLSAPDCAFCNYGEDILALSLPDKAAEKQTEENFLKFHSGYYGEVVDNIKQIAHHCFTGEELLEYLQAYTASLQAGAEKILEFAKGEDSTTEKLIQAYRDLTIVLEAKLRACDERQQSKPEPVREEWVSVSELDKARFWIKVKQTNYCWEWEGYINSDGYGVFRTAKATLAHRFAFELINGPISPRLSVCHRCDNPKCVNPLHLFEGTHHDNMIDKMNKGRSKSTFKTSKYLGVGWRSDSKNWRAYYSKGTIRPKSLGSFNSEIEAAKKYDTYCISIGDHSRLNFPLPNPPKPTEI